jgi:spore coat protein CotH
VRLSIHGSCTALLLGLTLNLGACAGQDIEPDDSLFDLHHLLDVRIDIEEGDWDSLRFERRSLIEIFGPGCHEPIPDAFNYYPANVQIDGEKQQHVGLRAKGLLGSINPARPSLKVKLQEYEEDLLYKGHKRFTFNNQNQDVSRLTTCLAYHIFEKMGVPASRCNFAALSINEEDMGVYANVEPIKKPLLQRLFGDDSGNLYEGTVADLRDGFTARIEKKTNEDDDDWRDVDELVAAIESDDNVFLEEIRKVIDLDAYIRFAAVEAMIGHWDSFSGNANNYYFYHDPISDKFSFLPWGPDGTFNYRQGAFTQRDDAEPQVAYGNSLLARRLYEHSEIQEHYRDTMRSMLEEHWDTKELLDIVDQMYGLTANHVLNPKEDEYLDKVVSVRNFIESRKTILMNELDAEPIAFVEELSEEPFCMEKVGDISIELSTTWGSLGAENPFAEGSGNMQGNLGSWPIDIEYLGPTAGIENEGEDIDSSSGVAVISALGALGNDRFIVLYLTLPKTDISAGAVLSTTDAKVNAYFLYVDDFESFVPLGWVGPGQIRFSDQTSTEDGAPFEANIEFELWGEGDSEDE